MKGALLRPNVKPRFATTDEKKLGGLLRAIDAFDGWSTLRAPLKFCALTFARPGEVRGATRSEINFDKALWRIAAAHEDAPAARCPPLSTAVEVLSEIWPAQEFGELIFHLFI